jgi:hypothetical protein
MLANLRNIRIFQNIKNIKNIKKISKKNTKNSGKHYILYTEKCKKTKYYIAPCVCREWKDVLTIMLVYSYLNYYKKEAIEKN